MHRVDLRVEGLRCAACVRSVERVLNDLEGVHASVSIATGTAAVLVDGPGADTATLVSAVERAGYRGEPAGGSGGLAPPPDSGDVPALTRRLNAVAAVAGALALPTWVPGLRPRRWGAVKLAATVPLVLWGGAPFHVHALAAARRRTATMDTLVSVGALVGLAAGAAGIARGRSAGHRQLDVAAGVIASMLGGRVLEAQTRGEAASAIRALLAGSPREASLLDPDDPEAPERRVPVDALGVGDRFRVRGGEAVATDGEVEAGVSALDASLLTGESVPVEVAPGSAVVGGAVNLGGPLTVRATGVGSDTALARIALHVTAAQQGKAGAQRLADRVAEVFVPAVIALAAGALAERLRRGRAFEEALEPALAVLVVACPCALGLATPAALMVGVGRGAQLGVFIRSPEVLERAKAVDTVLLDKTGTVTAGAMELLDLLAADGEDPEEVLARAGALEEGARHPIARAIAAAARHRGVRRPAVERFATVAGTGVTGDVDGEPALAGRRELLAEHDVTVPEALGTAVDAAEAAGRVAVLVAWEGRTRGVLVVADGVRPTSAAAVATLRELGLEPVLISGDREGAARAVAAEVGIERVIGDVRPEDKARAVRDLQGEGRVVAMAGDGVNDAPALAAADLGLAVGSGTDVAIEAADVTLASSDLRRVADAVGLARATYATIRANLVWALGYNAVALPLAVAGRVNPVVGSFAMAMSSVVVVGNSLRLRRFGARDPERSGSERACGPPTPARAAPVAPA